MIYYYIISYIINLSARGSEEGQADFNVNFYKVIGLKKLYNVK